MLQSHEGTSLDPAGNSLSVQTFGPRTEFCESLFPFLLCTAKVSLFALSQFSKAEGEEEITFSFPLHLHPNCSSGIWAAFQIVPFAADLGQREDKLTGTCPSG